MVRATARSRKHVTAEALRRKRGGSSAVAPAWLAKQRGYCEALRARGRPANSLPSQEQRQLWTSMGCR
jgi:hypothetical protein